MHSSAFGDNLCKKIGITEYKKESERDNTTFIFTHREDAERFRAKRNFLLSYEPLERTDPFKVEIHSLYFRSIFKEVACALLAPYQEKLFWIREAFSVENNNFKLTYALTDSVPTIAHAFSTQLGITLLCIELGEYTLLCYRLDGPIDWPKFITLAETAPSHSRDAVVDALLKRDGAFHIAMLNIVQAIDANASFYNDAHFFRINCKKEKSTQITTTLAMMYGCVATIGKPLYFKARLDGKDEIKLSFLKFYSGYALNVGAELKKVLTEDESLIPEVVDIIRSYADLRFFNPKPVTSESTIKTTLTAIPTGRAVRPST